ncbi:MAG: PilZ domain-containing protein [Halobacteriovoraceae bacterium]|nr:PilZ domain-containing protein [Halobacteriovoraceae bacterium]
MESHLALIKSQIKELEKRVFPRFPFNYMVFKCLGRSKNITYEVVDISYTGMQLMVRDGGHDFVDGEIIKGDIHWKGQELDVSCVVRWTNEFSFGVEFKIIEDFDVKIRNFLSVENLIKSIRPLHLEELSIDRPASLKYWLQSDGALELFIWQHQDGELSKFQIILLENFVEWQDGLGIRTGKVLTKRDLDTPLLHSDEFIFQIDETEDSEKINFAKEVVSVIPEKCIPTLAKEFLQLKL